MHGDPGFLSCEELKRWLCTLFMKFAIPATRITEGGHPMLIYSPLNLSIFFRPLKKLYNVGYAAHWLAENFPTLFHNEVTTTGWPPRRCPLPIKETRKARKPAHMDLSPFIAEFRSLTTMWLAELPFGLVDTDPGFSPMNIRHFEIAFGNNITWHGHKNIRAFSILMVSLTKVASTKNLRSLLLPGEMGTQGEKGTVFKRDCAVVTTWEWKVKANAGSFWLEEKAMRKMVEEGWSAIIFRDDNYEVCSKPVDLRDGLTDLEYWRTTKGSSA